MKSRNKYVRSVDTPNQGEVPSASPSVSEQNRHIGVINNALNKLLDGEMTPEEYLNIVSTENEKLSKP